MTESDTLLIRFYSWTKDPPDNPDEGERELTRILNATEVYLTVNGLLPPDAQDDQDDQDDILTGI